MTETAFKTTYRSETIAAFEQKQSSLRVACVQEAVINGNVATFLVAGSNSATAVTRGINGQIPFGVVDNTQLTRWRQGGEGIKWPKLRGLMDVCGNDAPLLWMNHDRGWDISIMRRRETETQRENRLLREENAALKRVLLGANQ